MDLEERKEKMKQLALSSYSNGGSIYRILTSGALDSIIESINIQDTEVMTSDEQFVMLLNETIHFIKSKIPPLNNIEIHLVSMLEGNVPDFLISNRYWGDNDNIEYFDYGIKRLVVENFFRNLVSIYEEYSKMLCKEGITSTLDLSKKEDVELVFQFLVKLVWCNYDNQINLGIMFRNYKMYEKMISDKVLGDKEHIVHRYYSSQFSILRQSYIEKISLVNKLLGKKNLINGELI